MFVKLTGTDEYINKGPEIRYEAKCLSLNVGVEIFGEPYFKGCLSYLFDDNAFQGSITYLGNMLWIKDPEIIVQWSRKKGFQIIKFIIPKLRIGLNLLGIIAKCAKTLYELITGIFSWGIQFKLKTS